MLLMSIKEYAESRNINDKILRKLIAEGKIAAGKIGRKWMLNSELVDDYFSDLTSRVQSPATATKNFDFIEALRAAKRRAAAS